MPGLAIWQKSFWAIHWIVASEFLVFPIAGHREVVLIQTFLLLALIKADQTNEPILTQGCKAHFILWGQVQPREARLQGSGNMVDYMIWKPSAKTCSKCKIKYSKHLLKCTVELAKMLQHWQGRKTKREPVTKPVRAWATARAELQARVSVPTSGKR